MHHRMVILQKPIESDIFFTRSRGGLHLIPVRNILINYRIRKCAPLFHNLAAETRAPRGIHNQNQLGLPSLIDRTLLRECRGGGLIAFRLN